MSDATVFCQISIVSPLPFSESWYWYWNRLPDGTCMRAVHTNCCEPVACRRIGVHPVAEVEVVGVVGVEGRQVGLIAGEARRRSGSRWR